MRDVKDLFKAEASNVWETMNCHNGNVGFKIPEYQRAYDWNKKNITRLLEDCLNGFYYLSIQEKQDAESFTFLGTLILVKEQKAENNFNGTSLSIVDGQQRLTTLILISCALIEEISLELKHIDELSQNIQKWLKEEVDFHLERLYDCILGQQKKRAGNSAFPRIIRAEDTRSRNDAEKEYNSIISKFLDKFSKYYMKQEEIFTLPDIKQEGDGKRFVENYMHIKEQIESIAQKKLSDSNLDCEDIKSTSFEINGIKSLFEKIKILESTQQNQALSSIKKGGGADRLIRLLLFASYFTKCVVLTRVETDDESSAFDIFDALNTTGEPLTALETFKPKVIQFENQHNGFKGSPSDISFNEISENFHEIFPNSDVRQKETKKLLVTFALYLDGETLPKDLKSQRSYLRERFDKVIDQSGPEHKHKFISSLADLTKFRRFYWEKSGINELCLEHSDGNIQLCFKLILDMKTSLALPILARYWSQYNIDHNESNFSNAVKALTAFIILRRSVTNNTGEIDKDLRGLMHKDYQDGLSPICSGLNHENTLLNNSQFKERLKKLLSVKKINVIDKESWVSKVIEAPLAVISTHLSRFLLLAAAHNCKVDKTKPGMLNRVRNSDERHYLCYEKMKSVAYATLEHIAPVSNPGSGWDENIYKRANTIHTLGNLTLLPQEENSSVGNSIWEKKKIFYCALSAETPEDQEELINKAELSGLKIKKKTIEILKSGERLHILDPITDVTLWDEGLIKRRSENIASLAWDTISPWLYE